LFHVTTYFIRGDEGFGTSCSRKIIKVRAKFEICLLLPHRLLFSDHVSRGESIFATFISIAVRFGGTGWHTCMKVVFSDPQVSGQEPFLRGGNDLLRDTSTFNTTDEPLFFPSLYRFLKQRIVISPIEYIKYSLHFRSDSSQYDVGFFSISMSPESKYFILHHFRLVSAVIFAAFCDGSSVRTNCFTVSSRYLLSEVIIFS
jgi:hypothetical protein